MPYTVIHDDCFNWIEHRRANSIHAVVTDPPYGLFEYSDQEILKRKKGNGVWRLPPAFDGGKRSPLPRFLTLSRLDHIRIRAFFSELAVGLERILVPGGHVVVASNKLLEHLVAQSFYEAGFEVRGKLARIVRTFSGGDRPKGAHEEFPEVSVLPRSCWEPWLILRKPLVGRVQDNLRKWKTGGLRRDKDENPFFDLFVAPPASKSERKIAPHPSIKPQALARYLARAALPLGQGIVLDPFMGSGAIIAACHSLGYEAIGIEKNPEYFRMAKKAIPKLASHSIIEKDALKAGGPT